MSLDPTAVLNLVEHILRVIPHTIIVIVLLTAPTLAWLLYRFIVQPRAVRYGGRASELLWICERCLSANDATHLRCYSCGGRREETVGDLTVIDGNRLVVLGRTDDGVDAESNFSVEAAAAAAAAEPPKAGRDPVGVGPGRFTPSTRRTSVGRPSSAVGRSAATPAGPRKAVTVGRHAGEHGGPRSES